jgi:hypothetical protein
VRKGPGCANFLLDDAEALQETIAERGWSSGDNSESPAAHYVFLGAIDGVARCINTHFDDHVSR